MIDSFILTCITSIRPPTKSNIMSEYRPNNDNLIIYRLNTILKQAHELFEKGRSPDTRS